MLETKDSTKVLPKTKLYINIIPAYIPEHRKGFPVVLNNLHKPNKMIILRNMTSFFYKVFLGLASIIDCKSLLNSSAPFSKLKYFIIIC